MTETPEKIVHLEPNQIFVFGSNTDGKHDKGAALTAVRKFGAKYGKGEGLYGQSYALPTVGNNLSFMSLDRVQIHVDRFIKCANEHPELEFLVTKVGCGLAGHKEKDIKPMFKDCPSNCILPKGWRG